MTHYIELTPAAAHALAALLTSSNAHDVLTIAAQAVAASTNPDAYHYAQLSPTLRARVARDETAPRAPIEDMAAAGRAGAFANPPRERSSVHVGQRVRFGRPHGQQHYGVVVKLNEKSIKIKGEDGRDWKVAHSLVHPA